MKLKILSFNGESFSSEKVISVTLMTGLWEITVLDNHMPIISSIKPSTMYVVLKDENGMERRDDFAIGSWVLEVVNSDVKIMSDMLIDVKEVDASKAENARKEALALMERYKDSKDRVDMEKFIDAEDMLLKSIAQLKLYDLRK